MLPLVFLTDLHLKIIPLLSLQNKSVDKISPLLMRMDAIFS